MKLLSNDRIIAFNSIKTKKIQLGQFFTPPALVDFCVKLRKNSGFLLEPSCGNGAFYKIKSNHDIFIELDESVIVQNDILNANFFDYPIKNKFNTIIGNPPFVDNSLFKAHHKTDIKVQANLYLYFLEKSFLSLKKQRRDYIYCAKRIYKTDFRKNCQ